MDDDQPITFRLPKELHRRLRRMAFDLEVSMNSIATEGIEARVAELEAAPKRPRSADPLDPIMKRLAGMPEEGGRQ